MKLKLFFLFSFCLILNSSAQIEFDDHLIFTGVEFTNSVKSADLNNNGYNDFIVTSQNLSWFENIDGLGNFGPQIIINSATDLRDIYAVDIDNDGDIDIVFITTSNRLGWHENLDGEGNFGPEKIISTEIDRGFSIIAADIDNDGDIDILSSSEYDNKIAWYENLDGQGNFGPQQIITTDDSDPREIFVADIDGDGILDLLTTSYENRTLSWYKNTGQGVFGPRQLISDNFVGPHSVVAADIDNDGYIDVLITDYSGHTISWFKNTDGLGNFGEKQIITSEVEFPTSAHIADIDGDGTMDLISTSLEDNKLAWYKNLDGLGTFGEQLIISTNLNGPVLTTIIDLDGDGDLDILVAPFYDNTVLWFENLGILGNQIFGNVKYDIAGNGCDPNDYPVANIMVKTTNGRNTFSTLTQENGDYLIHTTSGEFTTLITSLPDYFTATPAVHNSSFTGLNNADEANFCINSNQSLNDLKISYYPLSNAQAGYDSSYQIVYSNFGTNSISGDIELIFDGSKMEFLTSNAPISSQTSNTLNFDCSNLMPFETRSINLYFNVGATPINEIGDLLSFTSTINPIIGDLNPEDNIFDFDQIIVDSFDPNNIQVLEGSEIYLEDLDDYLHYIIRFQNTGNEVVENVKITNWLTYNYDWSTLQIENISHPGIVKIVGENNLEFIFDGIALPSNNINEEASKGFIQYKIKVKNNLEIYDTVFNYAKIYFDFGPPIITNTATTWIVENLSVKSDIFNPINIYPNPSNDFIYIQSNSVITKIQIINELGQEILTLEESGGIKSVDIDNLIPGLYFLNLIDIDNFRSLKKLIKVK